MQDVLAMAIYHKYKDDPNRKEWRVMGPNWYDVEIMSTDPKTGEGCEAQVKYQLSKEEVETAIDEYIVAKRADPSLYERPDDLEDE